MKTQSNLPPDETMFRALLEKDQSFEGVFFVGVKTTGIFCRPTCTARKPKFENVEFFPDSREALVNGYRPCMRCRPLESTGDPPDWVRGLISEIEQEPSRRLRDRDLRERGIAPERARRWFLSHHGMTFQAYQRTRWLGEALGRVKGGQPVTQVAMENGFESLSGFNSAFRQWLGTPPRKAKSLNTVILKRLPSPLGTMLAGVTDDGLCLLEFGDRRMLKEQIQRLERRLEATFVPGDHAHLRAIASQIDDYFAGRRLKFSIPLVLAGTPFQESVWNELQRIPAGQTRSYLEIATSVATPKSVRAVARANGDNRLAIVIPCHRVIGSDGSLTGYGGGLWRKQRLLDLERSATLKNA